MKPLFKFLLFITVSNSCSKGTEEPNPPGGENCVQYERIYSSDIYVYYHQQSIIVDNYYDNKCLNVIGSISHIYQYPDRITFNIASNHGTGYYQPYWIDCEIRGAALNENINFISTLKSGDIVSIYGRFNLYLHNLKDCPFWNFCMEMTIDSFDKHIFDSSNDCNVIYKKWACLGTPQQQCLYPEYFFVPHAHEQIVYSSIDKNQNKLFPYKNSIYTYVLDNCQKIILQPLGGGNEIIWNIQKIERDTLTVIDTNNNKFILYKS